MRLFFAISLPDPLRRALYAAAEPLRVASPRAGWVPAERLHLTLKFLGEQPPEAVGALREALARVAVEFAPLVIDVAGFGAFPSLQRPRVVWAGVCGDPTLPPLHHELEAACAALGHAIERRPFRPHVTLGRLRAPATRAEAAALARAARETSFRAEARIEHLDLMESRLTPAGAQYQVVASAPLGSGRR